MSNSAKKYSSQFKARVVLECSIASPKSYISPVRPHSSSKPRTSLPTCYARRAGIEGTISQTVRAFDLRRTRYIGQAKTHLQNIAIATATNFTRLAAFLKGIPKAQTRVSSFAARVDSGSR
jgi:hypothetical protein